METKRGFFTPPICRLMGGGWDLPELSEQRYMNLLPAKSEYPVHPDFLKITLSTSKVSMGLNDMDQEEQDRLRVSGKVLLKRERVDLISRTSSLSVGPDDHGVDKLIALATFEKLHLNTIESRKEVPLFFQVQTPSGSFQYESRPFIKISKPSKKKQTRKSPLLINSGSQIALFNRTKAQTANTRYLTYSPSAKALASCSTFWETWTIYSADDPDFDPSVNSDAGNTHTSFDIPHDPKTDVFFDTPGNKHHVAPCKSKERRGKRIATPPADPLNTGGFYNYPVPVHYGDVVVLQHTLSGVVTCPLIVRKIERRTEAVISSDPTKRNGLPFIQSDPLSPLHKVAFQKADEPGQYLALSDTLEGSRIQVHHTALSRYYRQYRAKDTGVKFFPRTNIPVGQDVPLTFVSGSAATEPRPPDTSKGTSDDVGESSIWTVVGVDHVESTFHMPRLNSHELTLLQIEPNQQMQAVDPSTPPRDGPPQPMVPPHLNIQHANPVPRLTSVFYRDQHSVSLYGTHLADSKLMAFFGPYPSPHTRVANVPNSSELALIADVPATWRTPKADLVVSHSENACSNSSTVPLLLVRDDGVIFRTGFYFCSQCS
ncbi:hypothetical protein DFS34DRAFT_601727 [Phlyctochytrium arcticum]|nr:hypothetical protein DFS34DRAFT_601727 [Phlyctochytrium arcticum]